MEIFHQFKSTNTPRICRCCWFFFYSHSNHFAFSYKNGILTCHWEHTEPFKSPDNRYRHSFQIECPLIHKVLACTNCICLWRYFQHSAELYLLHSIAIDCLPNTFNSNSIHLVYTPVCQSVRPSGGIQSVIGWYVWLDGFIHSFIGTYSYYSDVLGILECHRNRRQYLCDAITAPSPNGKKNFVRVFVFDAHWKVIHCWMLVGLLWIHIKIYCCQVCKWGGKYFRVPTLYMCNDLMDLERSAWNGTYNDGYGNAEYDRP